jgi:hypothetical protein
VFVLIQKNEKYYEKHVSKRQCLVEKCFGSETIKLETRVSDLPLSERDKKLVSSEKVSEKTWSAGACKYGSGALKLAQVGHLSRPGCGGLIPQLQLVQKHTLDAGHRYTPSFLVMKGPRPSPQDPKIKWLPPGP